ncbi:MAG TPA: hypothetical protein VGA38_06040 [Candidatus Limnocylindria bacterium]
MWNLIRSVLGTAKEYLLILDESIRFAAAAESSPRSHVVLSDEGSRISICIRPLRDGEPREFAERAA